IMLHQMGNHGPAYFKRYDEKFAKFTPVCEGNELAKCEHQALINAYDNALLATDDFIAQSIQWLQTHSNAYDVSMLYVSDH
ncbi:sulfatase-like hydrolase/transferase, partial [Escherichia coli]|nr:sulfatase-like hydrolase/transferase [Escherichia coli]